MKEKNRYDHALWRIMEQMLEVESMEDALSGSLDIIMDTIGSEAGAVWLLDPQTNRLYPMFHRGPVDISGISIENGTISVEGEIWGLLYGDKDQRSPLSLLGRLFR